MEPFQPLHICDVQLRYHKFQFNAKSSKCCGMNFPSPRDLASLSLPFENHMQKQYDIMVKRLDL